MYLSHKYVLSIALGTWHVSVKREDRTALALTEHVEERKVMERKGASGEEETTNAKKKEKYIV